MGTERAHKQYTLMSFSQLGDEVHRQTREYMHLHREKDYAAALRRVLDADEPLRRAYGRGGRR